MGESLGSRSPPSRAAWRLRGGAPSANAIAIVAVVLAAIALIAVLTGNRGSQPVETKTITIISSAPSTPPTTPSGQHGGAGVTHPEPTEPMMTGMETGAQTTAPRETATTEKPSPETGTTVEQPKTVTTSRAGEKTVTTTAATTAVQTTTQTKPVVEGVESSLVGSEGGRVRLGAVEIHFPRGAVEGEANVSAGLVSKDVSEEAGTTLVYRVELRGGRLRGEVELRFHYDESLLPEGVSEEEAQVGYLDEEGGYHSVEAIVDAEENVVVVRTDHFSLWIVSWPSRGVESWRPSVQKKVLEVPYYSQGDTGYCWATSMAMIIKYYSRSPLDPKPWDIASFYKIATDEGVSSLEFWTGLSTSMYLRMWLGAEPERHMWFPAIRTAGFTRYVVSAIDSGDPVAVFLKDHVVVIVGYYWAEGSEVNYYIHDPADPENGIYRMVPQSKLFSDIRGTQAVFTLRMPLNGAKEGDTPPVTVAVPSGVKGQDRLEGLTVAPVEGDIAPDTIYRVIWNGTHENGYYLGIEERRGKSLVLVERAVPDTYKLHVEYGVANAAQKPMPVRVGVFVKVPGSDTIHVESKEYNLGPGEYVEDSIETSQLYELDGWPLSEGAKSMTVVVEVVDPESKNLYDRVEFEIPLRPWSYLKSDTAKETIISALGLSPGADDVEYYTEVWEELPLSRTDIVQTSINIGLYAKRTIGHYEWDCDPKAEGTEWSFEFYSLAGVVVAHLVRPITDPSKYIDELVNVMANSNPYQESVWVCDTEVSSSFSEPLINSVSIAGGKAVVVEVTYTETFTSGIEGVAPLSLSARGTIILWVNGDTMVVVVSGAPILDNYEGTLMPGAEEALNIIVGILSEKGLISEPASSRA